MRSVWWTRQAHQPILQPKTGGVAMDRSSAFWAAFWQALGGAASLYDPPPPYWLFAQIPTPAQNFAAVGAALTQMVGSHQHLPAGAGD